MGRYNSGANTNLLYMINDCISASLAFIAFSILSEMYFEVVSGGYVGVLVSFMIIYILAGKDARIYNITTFFYPDRFFKRVTKSFVLATTVTVLLLYFDGSWTINFKSLGAFLCLCYLALLVSSFSTHYFLRKYFKDHIRAVMIGHITGYEKFIRFLNQSNMALNLVGYISIDDKETEGYLGNVKDLENIIHNNAIDQIFIMVNQYENIIDVQSLIDMCIEMGVTIRIIENSYQSGHAQSYVSSVGTYPVITYHTVMLNKADRAIKRTIDIIGSLLGIIIFSPIMIITAVAIKLDSKGPVIFKQKRIGMNGRNFNIYKFRSMCCDAEVKKKELMAQNEMNGEFMFKIKDDPRITKVGKFIRKNSIDELPQFFNVLIGNMSLVGTRPPTIDEVEQYKRYHWRRISNKPGITGLWQISGRNSVTDFEKIVELDTAYIDKWSVMVDFKIMIKTVIQMAQHKGAF